ncbi:MAG: S-adenosylmethionine:tRNA ribosyltransferase-isomerase [Bacteroidetes bacterium]|nr:MAG: S-adenosylmethionine:tRNA ribosyltransferase-isomerase [Bacteroidota bacterium]
MDKFNRISIEDYAYELPNERIAHYPLDKRDNSALLIYRNGKIDKDTFHNVPDLLPPGSLMVFNDTRVVQARLLFQKETGAHIEIFCLEPVGEIKDIQLAFQQKKLSSWYCLVGNAKKWKKGVLSQKTLNGTELTVSKGEKYKDGFIIHFRWSNEALSFAEVLEDAGKTPLPPYISRKAEEEDKYRYQTVFARYSGSVAAPTAGLHFTEQVLQNISDKNIEITWLTLHVGAGTFKPVSSDNIKDHQMHSEQVMISRKSIELLKKHCAGQIISVGTTSLRTLESIYWLGVKLINGYHFNDAGFNIAQWEPYEYAGKNLPPVKEALNAVLHFMNEENQETIHGETSLIIVPGYEIKLANILITNFHLPRSTLLLLVAAFVGDDWKRIYNFALENNFRFLSYGDSCLLYKNLQNKIF